MSCFHPLDAILRKSKKGKQSIHWPKTSNPEWGDTQITLPCGRCIGCRLDRSREWAIRCVHEASLNDENCFITLTYNDENLPKNSSLSKGPTSDFTLFMKKLRRKMEPKMIRFYMCGEYGENEGSPELGRPHYHACLFGIDFMDKQIYKITENIKLYASVTLDKIWGMGYASIGEVTMESAAYVARYITKKITGDQADQHYSRIDYDTGEFIKLTPEFTNMSRANGIGHDWFNKYSSDLYPKDFFTHNGTKMKPGKYYDKLFLEKDKQIMGLIKEQRIRNIKHEQNTPARLAQREKVKQAQFNQLKRNLK